MSRTTANAVRDAVGDTDPKADMALHLQFASALTDYVVSKDTAHLLTSALLTLIETYLAAHSYALRDPQYTSKSTGGASGSFIRAQAGQGLMATDWGQQACALDVSGTLDSIADGIETASMEWLGKPQGQQVPYWCRN